MPGAETEPGGLNLDARLVAPYLDYVTAFNAADLHSVARHLTEDLVFDWRDVMPALAGRHAFLEFYRTAWQHLAEKLTISGVRTQGDLLSAHISNRISVHEDWPDCPIAPMYSGACFTVSGRMNYRFRGNRICHITEAVHPSTTMP